MLKAIAESETLKKRMAELETALAMIKTGPTLFFLRTFPVESVFNRKQPD
jgi:hypothetical protein